MAESQIANENSFIRGLISEATGLNFPKDACTETMDCVFDSKGLVSRRLGIDYEASASTANTVTRNSSAVAEYLWESVAGDGSRSFLVTQVGTILHFWNVPSSGALSANKKSFTVDLDTYKVSGATNIGTRAAQFASGQGDLFVAHPNCEPLYISYDSGGDSITTTAITVLIRDLAGIEESIPFNVRPSSITTIHKYNLWNQGWYAGYANTYDTDNTPTGNDWVPYELWVDRRTTKSIDGYPSNADVWWQYKNSFDAFSLFTVINQGKTPPSSPAPKGHFIMKAFQQYKGYSKIADFDRTSSTTATITLYEGVPWLSGDSITVEGANLSQYNNTFTVSSIGSGTTYDQFSITGTFPLSTDEGPKENFYAFLSNTEAAHLTAGTNRPNCVAFYAGRVWYGGTTAHDFNDKIYFSKIIEQPSDYGRCYQVNDPTAEDLSDLLPSDGGVISIPDMGNMIKMIPVGQDLIIFATNGVWRISGSEGIGFRANDYSVSKLSAVPAISHTSFVQVEGSPIFWNNDGIYSVTPEGVQALTDKTIKTWFAALPTNSKSNAKGVYNPLKKVIYWLYRSTASTTTDNAYEYDRILCLNTITGAFYPLSIGTASGYPTVNGIAVTSYIGAVGSTTKFITTKLTSGTTYTVTFSEKRDTNYVDWETPNDGLDYSSYFTTGFKVPGEGLKQTFGNYINVFCNAEANSSLKLRAKWDYANSNNSGEWSSEQEVYVTRTHRDTLRRRVKLRGRGIACQLSFTSTSGKPFNLIGWSMLETVNPGP
jgi:hypothetical protein